MDLTRALVLRSRQPVQPKQTRSQASRFLRLQRKIWRPALTGERSQGLSALPLPDLPRQPLAALHRPTWKALTSAPSTAAAADTFRALKRAADCLRVAVEAVTLLAKSEHLPLRVLAEGLASFRRTRHTTQRPKHPITLLGPTVDIPTTARAALAAAVVFQADTRPQEVGRELARAAAATAGAVNPDRALAEHPPADQTAAVTRLGAPAGDHILLLPARELPALRLPLQGRLNRQPLHREARRLLRRRPDLRRGSSFRRRRTTRRSTRLRQQGAETT